MTMMSCLIMGFCQLRTNVMLGHVCFAMEGMMNHPNQ